MFTTVYSCLHKINGGCWLIFTRLLVVAYVYNSSIFTAIYSCLPSFKGFLFTYYYPFLLPLVYSCLPMFPYVYLCLPMFNIVYSSLFTDFYLF